MRVITKGFNDAEIAERVAQICKERAEAGMNKLIDFGKLWGVTYDIAYRGNETIEVSNITE